MMARLLLFTVLVWLGANWLKRVLAGWSSPAQNEAAARAKHVTSAPPPQHAVQTMLACSQCGVHIPQSEAVFKHEKAYCSPEHAKNA